MIYRIIKRLMPTSAVAISIAVFIIASLIVTHVSRNYYDGDFMENVLVEAHGMLFDILVIGVIILFLNKLTEKRIENQRYIDEIDDFRGWEAPEAAHRIAGNLKRLKRNGYKGKVDLRDCYLGCVDLHKDGLIEYFSKHLAGINLMKGELRRANLQDATLYNVDLQKADLRDAYCRDARFTNAEFQGAKLQNADLHSADLREADLLNANLQYAELREISNLTLEQLSVVKSLYKALLDPELLEQVRESYPHLLEKPEDYIDPSEYL